MKSYRVSMPIWGTSVVTLMADSEQEAADMGEVIFRTAIRQQSTFEQFLGGDEVVGGDVISNYEVEHTIDTEFEIEAALLYDEGEDPRVEAMARAYAQDIYGIDDLSQRPEMAAAARRIALIMLEAAEPAPIDRNLVDVLDLRKGDQFSLEEETGEEEVWTVTDTPVFNPQKGKVEVWVDSGDMGPGTTMIEFFRDDAVKVLR